MPSTIVVIDDDPAILSFLEEALGEEGYTIYSARTGWDALACLATRTPQLIIADIRMPAMDGVAFCSHLQTDPSTAHIPIILCSAGQEDAIKNCCAYAAFLDKPFDLDDLLATVAHVLAGKRA